MISESAYNRILEYLKKQGQTNTFRLARELGIDRHKLLNIIRELEEKQAIEFKSGIVKFLRFPKEEKPIKVKKAHFEAKKKRIHKKKAIRRKINLNLQAENKRLKEKLLELEDNIKRKANIKNKKIREQSEHIENLGKTIKELQKKANLPPKIIRKTIIKKVPIKVKEEAVKQKKKEIKSQRFKIPKFDISWVKNIQQLSMPKFMQKKINIGKPKINFAKLNKNIQQLHVPEMFKKGG